MDYSGKIITKNPVEPSQTSAPGVWTLDQATQAVQGNNWPIAYVPNPISRSLRFNSADSAYLNRTPSSSPTGTTKGTWSFWIKRTKLATEEYIFGSRDGGNSANTMLRFESGDTLRFYQHNGSSVTWNIITTQVFRDVGAWMHILVALDTTQATDSNRIKIYVNGTQVTAFGTASYPSQNANMTRWAASGVPNYIGNEGTTPGGYGDYYLTETYYIDGQALDPTYFGMTDPRTGAWIPKKYSGTYGTNGFYLNFSDNSSTAALGTDYSGNSNTWTANGFSVTTGSGNDSMTDVPTPWIPYNTTGDVGGVVRGNYATLNPLQSAGTLANGNLDWTGPTGNGISISTMGSTSGKWYWECNLGSTSNKGVIGVVRDPQQADINTDGYSGNIAGRGYALDCETSPPKIKFNGTATNYGTQPTATSDVLMVAIDLTNSSIFFGLNGTWFNSSNPATNTSPAFSSITAGTYFPFVGDQWGSASSSWVINFGQRSFAYTPPAGFKSLCTTNLPEPTILDGGDYFNAVLYTGTGSARSVTGVGFAPNFTWIKVRSAAYDHQLYDIIRGAGKYLYSNSTVSEQTDINQLSSFDSDGFSLGSGVGTNESGQTFVAWNWKANGAGVSNTAGTITSTVSANQTAGFSIVTYTGSGTGSDTIGHGLDAAPSWVITKNRSNTDNWIVYFAISGTKYYAQLNLTNAASSTTGYTSPTSTVFNPFISLGSGDNYVAYCFAAVPGYSAFGSYTGNGSSDGPFVYCGFRPRYVMIKRVDAGDTTNWFVFDTERAPYNLVLLELYANLSNAEGSDGKLDILSNGFKIRTSGSGANSSSINYIYMAFAENPFKYSNAR